MRMPMVEAHMKRQRTKTATSTGYNSVWELVRTGSDQSEWILLAVSNWQKCGTTSQINISLSYTEHGAVPLGRLRSAGGQVMHWPGEATLTQSKTPVHLPHSCLGLDPSPHPPSHRHGLFNWSYPLSMPLWTSKWTPRANSSRPSQGTFTLLLLLSPCSLMALLQTFNFFLIPGLWLSSFTLACTISPTVSSGRHQEQP